MSNPKQSPIASIDGFRLMEVLGFPRREAALPTHSTCPLCDAGVMQHFRDHAAGGEWYHCSTCKASGDMISLAARLWGLSPRGTIARLVRLGFDVPDDDPIVRDYLSRHRGIDLRTTALWTMAQKSFVRIRGGQLFGHLKVRCEIPPDRWLAGPGGIVGQVACSNVERCFAPKSMEHADARRQRGNPSAAAMFRGEDWHDVLALPFYDLPGRIAAFQFLGRDGDSTKDAVFKFVNRQFRGNQHGPATFEAGLALHPRALEAADQMGRTLIAMDGWRSYVRLQLRWFEQWLAPLPLTVWHDSRLPAAGSRHGGRVRTYNAWEMIGNRRLIFWMPKFRLATLRQAVERDALISTVGPLNYSPTALQEYVWKRPPLDLWRHIEKAARPWPQALTRIIADMTEGQLEQLFRGLECEGLDAAHILRQCGPSVQSRTAGIFVETGQRTARLGGVTIIERSNAWYAKRTKAGAEELIVDAVVRIDETIYHRRQDRTYLKGRVICRGGEFEFLEEFDVVRRDGFAWLRKFLIQRQIDFLRGDGHSWSGRLLDLAGLFQEPRLTQAIESVGWDEDQRAFVLPRFRITSIGEVKDHGDPPPIEQWPGLDLEAPKPCLTPTDVDLGDETADAGELFWAVAACMAANIVAPAFQEQAAAIGLVGEGVVSVGETVAVATGCLSSEVHGVADVRQCLTLESLHRWPLLVREGRRLSKSARCQLLANIAGPRHLVTALRQAEVAAALADGWTIVVGNDPADLIRNAEQATLLLPAYIKDLGERLLTLTVRSRSAELFCLMVLDDLAAFVERCGGDADAVLAARKRILVAGSPQAQRQLAAVG